MDQLKLFIFGTLVVLGSWNAHADDTEFSDILDRQNFLSEIYGEDEPQLYQSKYMNGVQVDDACASFVQKDGSFGPNGRIILEELTSNRYPFMMRGESIKQDCPAYPNLDSEKKSIVWVLIMTAIAHFESQCRGNASNREATDGHAYGLFQLHKNKSDMADGGVGGCTVTAAQSEVASTRCAVSMMNMQMKRENGNLFDDGSYWDVLRPSSPVSIGGRKKYELIRDALRKSAGCKLNSI